MRKKFNKLGSLAISQIIILILGTIAVAYIIGSEIELVSGQTVGAEFDYGNRHYKIYSFNVVLDDLGNHIRKDTSVPCKTKWFWDVNKDGMWGNEEQNRLDKNLNVCMLQGFVTAMQGATVPKAEVVIGPEVCTSIGGSCIYKNDCSKKGGTIKHADCPEPYVCCIPFTAELPPAESTSLIPSSYTMAMIAMAKKKAAEEKKEEAVPAGEKAYKEMEERRLTEPAEEEVQVVSAGLVGKWLQKNLEMQANAAAGVGHIIQGAGTALIISVGIESFKTQLMNLGLSEGQVEALQTGLSMAWFAGESTYGILQWAGVASKTALKWGIGVGVGIGIVTMIIFFSRKGEQKTVIFECVPWQAQTKGENCKECGKNGLPCSEYQCKSLGQGCQLLNDEKSEEAVCVWVNRQDTQYPIIEPDEEALLDPVFYKYKPDKTISPPDRGVLISYENAKTIKTIGSGTQRQTIGCAPTFTPLRFGVNISEPAICKIDPVRKDSFDEMSFFMSGGIYKEKHSYTLSLPSLESLEAEGIEIESGDMELHIRCQDANGNSNPATFVFKFCIDEGPDETPPEIVTTDLINNMPIAAGTQSIDVNVYVNEPLASADGGCKWSHQNQPYNNMENDMTSCVTNASAMNPQGFYSCKANLSGIKDGLNNKFYFRCKDKAGNINTDSYEFTIVGTQPLVISSAKPNATTIKESTSPVKVTLEVKTSAGYNDGAATCFYSDTGDENDYSMFLNTGTYQHSHELWLAEGNHIYYIKCVDLGGNSDYETITFDVETDTDEPIVTRVYHEDTYLKIITDEEAECVYDVVSCSYNFEDGIKMTALSDTVHYTDWATNRNFYIKCSDTYGNKPLPNKCSIIVRPQIYF